MKAKRTKKKSVFASEAVEATSGNADNCARGREAQGDDLQEEMSGARRSCGRLKKRSCDLWSTPGDLL